MPFSVPRDSLASAKSGQSSFGKSHWGGIGLGRKAQSLPEGVSIGTRVPGESAVNFARSIGFLQIPKHAGTLEYTASNSNVKTENWNLASFFPILALIILVRSSMMFIMNKLNTDKRVAIISALVEGNSLRSTQRMTGVSINDRRR